ncbi:hypothetical protein EMIT0P176_20189 [Pseudomonas sp. IT-P176]
MLRPLMQPSILQPGAHCNASETDRSRAVPQTVQSVTRPVSNLAQPASKAPPPTAQTLDLQAPQGTGPTFALGLYQRLLRVLPYKHKSQGDTHHALRSPRY